MLKKEIMHCEHRGEIPTEGLKVVRMCNKSVVFRMEGIYEDYYATKRVANEILSGQVKSATVIESVTPHSDKTKWLATPSIF